MGSSQGATLLLPLGAQGAASALHTGARLDAVEPSADEQGFIRVSPLLRTVSVGASAVPPSETRLGTEVRHTVATYTVRDGDVLSEIANSFGVTTMTVVWANQLSDPDSLEPGSKLRIPPTSGVLHVVKAGESIASIAQKYNVRTEDITSYVPNRIANPDALVLQQDIMIPGAEKPADPPPVRLALNPPPSVQPAAAAPVARPAPPAPAPAPAAAPAGGPMQWPTFGPIFSFFSSWHRGLDISPPYGTPVYAAESGVVAWVKYEGYGYGYHLLINHGNGYQTLYAHFSEILVQPGQRVGRGQAIGRVGSTGRSTGPHLHFEVHLNGIPVNPLSLLPR